MMLQGQGGAGSQKNLKDHREELGLCSKYCREPLEVLSREMI